MRQRVGVRLYSQNGSMMKSQQTMYDAIVAFTKREGYTPNFTEIAREIGCSPQNVHQTIDALAWHGVISIVGEPMRAILITGWSYGPD